MVRSIPSWRPVAISSSTPPGWPITWTILLSGCSSAPCTFIPPTCPAATAWNPVVADGPQGHIPGAGFADLQDDLSDRSSPLRFMMPPAAQFADAMSRYGVGPGVRVVLYDRAVNMWAARIWWMLRAFGWDDAAVLDGGWKKWTREGRPVATDDGARPPRTFIARPRPELIADKAGVLAALGEERACVLNALTAEQHRGTTAPSGRRPGRIAGSANVPAGDLVDPETHAYLPEDVLRAKFSAAGALGGAAGRHLLRRGHRRLERRLRPHPARARRRRRLRRVAVGVGRRPQPSDGHRVAPAPVWAASRSASRSRVALSGQEFSNEDVAAYWNETPPRGGAGP